jgi:ankyrin repeat protein
MSITRNKFLVYLIKLLPNEPIFLNSILNKYFKDKLNNLLIKSMKTFNYVGFKLALYLGADPNIDKKVKIGEHLVTQCAGNGNILFLDTLLQFGGSVRANMPKGGYLPIHMAAVNDKDLSIEILFKHGANINAIYELEGIDTNKGIPLGWTPLVCACMHNSTLAAKKLLDLGANPFDINEKGIQVMDICLKMKNQELAQYILKKQINKFKHYRKTNKSSIT